MEKIIVTGGTGFVGSYLLRYLLENGYTNIVATRRVSSPMSLVADIADRITWAEGDVLDVPFLEDILRGGAKYVFHCAAVVSFDPRDRENMYAINVEGTANLVNIALEYGCEKFIHVSSVAAIGRDERSPDVSEANKFERSPLNSHYAVSKWQAEQEVWRGEAEGLNIAIVNPSVILGAQYWANGTGKLFEQVWEGLRFYSTGATGYVDVRDVARFTLRLAESDITGQRFLLNGENMPYKTMFEMIADVLEKPKATIKVTPFLREIAWRVEWLRGRLTGKKTLITRETARASGTTFRFHNQKSLAAFPDFSYTPIAKTIAETGKIFLEAQKEGKNYGILTIN